ncbi:MAG: NADH:flavin oxidoreductase [Nocardioides sp.]|uniref:NADH:flavin oxidoreductase n=1 Tax=Nocardioides sp. TaxID=35761 RepID=UPI003F0CCF3B
MSVPSLSDPLDLAHGPSWPNRLALAPLTNLQSHRDGTVSDDERGWLAARARGGFGHVSTAAAWVRCDGHTWDGQLGAATEEHDEGLARLAATLRETGTTSSVQLHHGGKRATPALHGLDNVSAAADAERHTRALSTAEVEEVVDSFVQAAVMAEYAGFDGVSVHAAHGYLLGQFLDPRSNERTDRYGGSVVNRLRIVLDVLAGIREATSSDFQVGVRLTPEGYGIPLVEGREHAREVFASGLVDHVDMSLWDVYMAPRRDDSGGRIIDRFVDLERGEARLGVTGKVLGAADARWCLEQGADYVGVGIGAILHHDFARRALAEADFTARGLPVTRDDLRAEHLGEAFIDYLADDWDDFVS